MSAASTTAGSLTTRSQHDTRFVHNLRLWGKEGQEAIEQTHVLALGCTSTTCQTIKNLVLPGAGGFTLVDNRKVTPEEAQSNFFLSSDVKGPAAEMVAKKKGGGAENHRPYLVDCAAITLEGLHAPNEETGGVTGTFLTEDPNAFVTKNGGDDLARYLLEKKVNVVLVAAAVVKDTTIATLASIIEGRANSTSSSSSSSASFFSRVLVLVLHVSGYVGAIRMASVRDAMIVRSVQAKEETFDTRYNDPFPALKAWMDSKTVATVPVAERTRIPYFVLAYHALKAYTKEKQQKEHSGNSSPPSASSIITPDTTEEWKGAQRLLAEKVCTLAGHDVGGVWLSTDTDTDNANNNNNNNNNNTTTLNTNEGVSSSEEQQQQQQQQQQVLDVEDEVYTEAIALLTRAKGDLRARSVPELSGVWRRADAVIKAKGAHADLFWFIAKAIQIFKENNNNNLPLSLEIPDFHTNTEWYRELVALYRAESAREVAVVAATTRTLLEAHGAVIVTSAADGAEGKGANGTNNTNTTDSASPTSSEGSNASASPLSPSPRTVSTALIEAECKEMVPHARYLAVTQYEPLSTEYPVTTCTPTTLTSTPSSATHNNTNNNNDTNNNHNQRYGASLSYCAEEAEHDPCGWYIALKVAHSFASAEGRWPGAINNSDAYAADQRAVAARYASASSGLGSPAASSGGGGEAPAASSPFSALSSSSSPSTSPRPHSSFIAVNDAVDKDCNWVSSDESVMAQIEEVVRGGGAELITTAATIGALAAQEVLKYVQRRYIPAGSLIVFDGYASLTYGVGLSARK